MPEKRIVVTRADVGIKEMTDITHPIIKEFAKKWDADFEILNPDRDWPVHRRHYRIMQLKEILENYDRAISIDSDVLINPKCYKNPFVVVSKDRIGSVCEDVGTRAGRRRELIGKVQKRFGDVGWKSGYINTGFLVVSKEHKDIFQPINGKYWDGFGFDDIHLGWQINKRKYLVYSMHHKWNFMTMFSENWCKDNRFNAFIIHYAGRGMFDHGVKNRMEQIRLDHKKLYG